MEGYDSHQNSNVESCLAQQDNLGDSTSSRSSFRRIKTGFDFDFPSFLCKIDDKSKNHEGSDLKSCNVFSEGLEVLLKMFLPEQHLVVFLQIRDLLTGFLHAIQYHFNINIIFRLRSKLFRGSFPLQTIQLGERRRLTPGNMFAHISLAFVTDRPPSSLHVLESYISARVRLVAPHDDWEQQAVVNLDIFELDVSDVDPRLCLTGAFRVEGIEHAARASLIRLFLLLRTQVNGPPDRLVHRDVLIQYILYPPRPFISGVGFDINSLERFLEMSVSKGDIPDAVDILVGRDASDRQAHPQSHRDILDQDIFSAIGHGSRGCVRWFRDNNVIIVLAGDVVDMKVSAAGVDAIGIEREHWNDARQVISFEDVHLSSCVDFYVQIVKSRVDCLICLYMKRRRVLQNQIMDYKPFDEIAGDQVRTICMRRHILFCHQPGVQPPDVPSPVNLASSSQSNVPPKVNRDEILVRYSVLGFWIVFDSVARRELPSNFKHHIVDMVQYDGQGVISMGGDDDDPIIACRGCQISLCDGLHDGDLVGLLGRESILIFDCPE